jgi:hypothetical protein
MDPLVIDQAIDASDSRELVLAVKSIRADIKKTRSIIAQLTDEAARKEQIVRSLEEMIRGKGSSSTPLNRRNPRKEPGYQKVTRLCREVMIREGRPLDRHEALSKITEAGFEPNVSNPLQFVAKTLWASDEFIPTNKGYWPSDLPLPEGAIPSDRRRAE